MTETKNKKKTIRLGITGGFCSGKSTVTNCFKDLGATIFDCDQAAHASLEPKTESYDSVVAHFGEEILDENKLIDRTKLGAIVFEDKEERSKLEQIIHPFVRKKMEEFINQAKEGVLAIEVPLLFEGGLEKIFDYVVVVSASNETVQSRAKQRFPELNEAEVNLRINSQIPLSEKESKAHFVINNNESGTASMLEQVKSIWNSITVN